jgi:hypothetical protein
MGLGGCTVYYVWEPRAFITPPKNPLVYERLYVSIPLYTDVFRFKYIFNVSIREYFSVLNVFIVCIHNTAVFKLIPLVCTHVYSYMFSIVHPPRDRRGKGMGGTLQGRVGGLGFKFGFNGSYMQNKNILKTTMFLQFLNKDSNCTKEKYSCTIQYLKLNLKSQVAPFKRSPSFEDLTVESLCNM